MTPLTVGITLGIIAILAAVGAFLAPRDNYGPGGWQLLAAIIAILCAIVAIMIPSVIYGTRSVGHTNCNRYEKQTGRETKFVLLNSWAEGDCLTRGHDGKWIPIEQIGDYNK